MSRNFLIGHLLRTISLLSPEQKTDGWFELRKSLLGASEIHKAYGDSTCFIKDKVMGSSFGGNIWTKHGNKFEPIAASIYAKENSYETFEMCLIRHAKFSWLGASPDRLVFDPKTKKYHLIEIKCPPRRTPEDGKIPREYWFQMQTQMACCGICENTFIDCKFLLYTSKSRFLKEDDGLKFGLTKGAVLVDKSDSEKITYPDLYDTKEEWAKWIDLNSSKGVVEYWTLAKKVQVRKKFDEKEFLSWKEFQIKRYKVFFLL